MQKSLIVKSDENGLLNLNLDEGLVAAMREVKLMKSIEKQDIPDIALDLHLQSNSIWVRITVK